MASRRDFLKTSGAVALSTAMPALALGHDKLEIHSRPIPGTGEMLPMVGLGNSRVFQDGDLEATRELIELFTSYGGSYVDTLGPSRFTVASVMQARNLQSQLFVGTYLGTVQYEAMAAELERVRAAQGKDVLDLVLTYDFKEILAEPERYLRLKETGLTRYIGAARHKLEFHEPMMQLMDMGAVDFLQVNYSPLEPEAGDTVLPMAQEKGVAILVNRAFANGDYFDVVRDRELPEWAAEFDCESWAQFSLKFILSHPAVTCVLTETANPEHVTDNLGAGMGRLPDEATRAKMLELVQSFVAWGPAMITVHHLENSRSQRIIWLLEELGIDYEIKRYGRDKQTGLAPPELLDVHPLGKAPVITDGDRTVAESGAIIEYLMYEYDDGRLRPEEGTAERLAYNYWLHYAEGTFAPLMILSLVLSRIDEAPMPFFLRPVAKGITQKVRDAYLDANVIRNLEFMDATLRESRWFCGHVFTAADVQMSFALEAAEVRSNLTEKYPHLAAFLETIRARPAYKRALDKGGHYELMGAGRSR